MSQSNNNLDSRLINTINNLTGFSEGLVSRSTMVEGDMMGNPATITSYNNANNIQIAVEVLPIHRLTIEIDGHLLNNAVLESMDSDSVVQLSAHWEYGGFDANLNVSDFNAIADDVVFSKILSDRETLDQATQIVETVIEEMGLSY